MGLVNFYNVFRILHFLLYVLGLNRGLKSGFTFWGLPYLVWNLGSYFLLGGLAFGFYWSKFQYFMGFFTSVISQICNFGLKTFGALGLV